MPPSLIVLLAMLGGMSWQPSGAPGLTVQRSIVERDALTDALRAHATLAADGLRLRVGCDFRRSERVEVSVETGLRLASNGNFFSGRTAIRHRFDEGPVRRLGWKIEQRRADLPNRAAGAFIQSLRGAGRVALRLVDVEGREVTHVLDASEFGPALDEVLQQCQAERSRARAAR